MSSSSSNSSEKQKNEGRSLLLFRKRSSALPPPTATTTMLESMLDAKEQKRANRCGRRRRRPPKPKPKQPKETKRLIPVEQQQQQQQALFQDVTINTAKRPIVLCTGSLEDAPTFLPSKRKAMLPPSRKLTSSSSTTTTTNGSISQHSKVNKVSTNTRTKQDVKPMLSKTTQGSSSSSTSAAVVKVNAVPPPLLGLTIAGRGKKRPRTTTAATMGPSSSFIKENNNNSSVPIIHVDNNVQHHISGDLTTAQQTARSGSSILSSSTPNLLSSSSSDMIPKLPPSTFDEQHMDDPLDSGTRTRPNSSTDVGAAAVAPVDTSSKNICTSRAFPTTTTNNNSRVMMKPTSTSNTVKSKQQVQRQRQDKVVNNDNFVKLNMKNSAGACRGARNNNKRGRRNSNSKHATQHEEKDDDVDNKLRPTRKQTTTLRNQSGVDPLDDFIDGVYHNKANTANPSSSSMSDVPKCSRHQRPCKLLVVKKNTSGNKGRQFYVCSLPRGEQCSHFEWADNTIHAAQQALVRNTSFSGFVARQVAAYMDRFQTLTVPELRNEAKRRKLPHGGKRRQLLMRLSIWIRDEVVKTGRGDDDSQKANASEENRVVDTEDLPELSDDDGSVSSEELELCHSARDETKSNNDTMDDDSSDEEDDTCSQASVDMLTTETLIPPYSPPVTLQEHLNDLFGYEEFREGQEWAVRRCLENKRTLLVAPTGFGKSLCYALPAALMDGVCIVVSPLISLMQDQLRQLPPRIPAATLSGSLNAAAMAATVDDVIRNRLKIIFVSPERLASPSFRRLFQMRWNSETNTRERSFPAVSLLCVDEAHCVSQWGHNFRPSYLRLKSLLDLIEPASVLALTATAGPLVVTDICDALRIPRASEADGKTQPENANDTTDEITSADSHGVKILAYKRDNIDVCCKVMASEGERLSLLTQLLSESKKEKKDHPKDGVGEGRLAHGSVIVYVWRQRDSVVVAENLMASGVEGGVVIYHGGMDSNARAKAQSMFMRGKARICVATVAFGMGINKADVAGVVHMYLPSSPENYLQETGRAGRDGRPARAIALVLGDEVVIKHSLAHSNMLSTSQIRALLQILRNQVIATLDIISNDIEQEIDGLTFGASLDVALPIESTIMATDCKVETVETLLSLLEETNRQHALLRVQGTMTDRATITLKRHSLEKLSKGERLAECISKCATCLDSADATKNQEEYDPQTQEQRFLAYSFGSYTFSIARCASLLSESAEPRHVFATLRRLQKSGELELNLDSSPTGSALHVKVDPNGIRLLTSSETFVDEIADELTARFSASVGAAAKKTLEAKHILHRVASVDQSGKSKGGMSASLALFRELVEKYFDGHEVKDAASDEQELPRSAQESSRNDLHLDVTSLLRDMKRFPNFQQSNRVVGLDILSPDVRDYTALAVTKFLHAIDTPRSPYAAFASHSLYGKWRDVEFLSLMKEVEAVLDPTER